MCAIRCFTWTLCLAPTVTFLCAILHYGRCIQEGKSPYHPCKLVTSSGSTSDRVRLWSSPSQVRLASTGRPGEMSLSWVSPARLLGMTIKLGRKRKRMDDVTSKDKIHVTRYNTPWRPGGGRSPYIYYTTLHHLQADTR